MLARGPNNVSWTWISPLSGRSSLIMAYWVNVNIYGSPFCLAMAHSHCLMASRKYGGLSTLSNSWVIFPAENNKNISWPFLSLLRGWGNMTLVFIDKFASVWLFRTFYLAIAIGRDGSLSTLRCSCGLLDSRKCKKRFFVMTISALRMRFNNREQFYFFCII